MKNLHNFKSIRECFKTSHPPIKSYNLNIISQVVLVIWNQLNFPLHRHRRRCHSSSQFHTQSVVCLVLVVGGMRDIKNHFNFLFFIFFYYFVTLYSQPVYLFHQDTFTVITNQQTHTHSLFHQTIFVVINISRMNNSLLTIKQKKSKKKNAF